MMYCNLEYSNLMHRLAVKIDYQTVSYYRESYIRVRAMSIELCCFFWALVRKINIPSLLNMRVPARLYLMWPGFNIIMKHGIKFNNFIQVVALYLIIIINTLHADSWPLTKFWIWLHTIYIYIQHLTFTI